jgi:pimeloyl-ACP methyl ester carboxylesterase
MRHLARWSMSYGPEARITSDDLARIQAPTLVIWGGHEPYGGRESADLVARALPHARSVFLPDAGHLPWLDEPAVVGRAISEFVSADESETRVAA